MSAAEEASGRRRIMAATARYSWPGAYGTVPPPVAYLPSHSEGILRLEADDERRVLIVYPANGALPTIVPFEHVYAMYEAPQ